MVIWSSSTEGTSAQCHAHTPNLPLAFRKGYTKPRGPTRTPQNSVYVRDFEMSRFPRRFRDSFEDFSKDFKISVYRLVAAMKRETRFHFTLGWGSFSIYVTWVKEDAILGLQNIKGLAYSVAPLHDLAHTRLVWSHAVNFEFDKFCNISMIHESLMDTS